MIKLPSLRSSLALLSLSATAAALAVVAAPAPAYACGGLFCDNLPEPMSVDQNGEDILFVTDGPNIEVHVRIQYAGEAERFAWVLPLQAAPTSVKVGSDPLFTALSNATAANWRVQRQYECEEEDPNWGDEGDGDTGGDGDGDGGGPDIVFQEIVGAFEVVVLEGGTAQEVIDFLNANNYAQDPEAEPILQEYLDEGFLFAAVKLAAGAEVEEIHPLAFQFPGNEPCVPIRLTRIAAQEDMGIRAYFLGDSRWAPTNYAHVVLNPLAYQWTSPGGPNYLELLGAAVDEAGGRAFATEYAGGSGAVSTFGIYNPSWDETAFVGVDPIQALDIIGLQGLNIHPLIQSLLLEFIPPPDGIEATDFWNNIEFYADMIDLNAWDADAFAAALLERIIDPAAHASDLLSTWPQLTRLNTTISPGEMIADPTFHAAPDLPDFDGSVTTVDQVLCGGDQIFHVDVEGADHPVCVPSGESYPDWAMPAALRVEQIPALGPPQVAVDNLDQIVSIHAEQQADTECMSNGGDGDGDGGSGDGDGDGDGGSGDGGTNGEGGTGGDAGLDGSDSAQSSCACTVDPGPGPVGVAFGLLILGLLGPWRRRD